MTQFSANLTLVGNVQNPFGQKIADGSQVANNTGQSGEVLVSEVRGKFAQATLRAALFSVNVTAVQVPVIASGLVSVFSLYNPVNSGVNLELVDMDLGLVASTTVVNTIGLYYSPANLAIAGTFSTNSSSTILAGLVGAGFNPRGQFYSAYTHSGTPVRHAIIATWGATSTTLFGPVHYDFDGKVIIPPGVVTSVACTTAHAEASGTDISLRWMETPA